jgi:mono/diheme cytochrome c family protein
MARFVLRLNHFILAISFMAIVVAYSAEPAYANAALIARGQALATTRCGRCHAIGKTGESTNPKSPPFRYLSRRYPISDLQEALAEGIIVGHEGLEMPQFQFSPEMIDALLAYMDSVQAK